MRYKIWDVVGRVLTGIWLCISLVCLFVFGHGVKEVLTGNVEAGLYECIGAFIAAAVFTVVYELLEYVISFFFTLDRRIKRLFSKDKNSSSYSRSRSSSSSWSSGDSFSASEYVSKNCPSRIYGIVSQADLSKIDNDSSLTPEQKKAVKDEYDRQAGMYY